jgi:hypothetical protein
MEFTADDLQSFIDWHTGEEADNVEANKNVWCLKVNGLQQLYEVGRIPDEEFWSSSKELRLLCRKQFRA